MLGTIIEDISRIMILDVEDKKTFQTAVKLCEAKGCVSKHELMQMTNIGLPIARIYATITRKKVSELSLSDIDSLSFGDLACILGIFAQDLMVQSQQSRLNKYQ